MIPLVLSIDDDRTSQILMAAYLKDVSFCHSFVSKANGQEALNYLKEVSGTALWPNMLFLDIKMPVLDGWGFLEGFTALTKGLAKKPPIVMISATRTEEDMDRVAESPLVSDLIIKPINSAALSKLISLPELTTFFDEATHELDQELTAS